MAARVDEQGRVAGLVQRRRQARLADHEGGLVARLLGEEGAGGHGGGPDVLLGDPQAGALQARGEVTRGEERVVGQNKEALGGVDPAFNQFGCTGESLLLVHEDAVHVGEPAFNIASFSHDFIILVFSQKY